MTDLVNKPTVESLLQKEDVQKRFKEILGTKAPGFISSIISATKGNPELAKCDPTSILSSAAIAATLDLPINPSLGFAYIIPYSGQAQFQLGWRAYVQLAMRTGQYHTINSTEVYEGELKRYDRFTGHIEFDSTGKKSDKIIGYVAYIKLLNGFEKWLYMTKEECEAHGKKYSKSFSHSSSRWKQDFDAMSKKTVLKLLLNKYGILSIEMQTALTADQGVMNEHGDIEYIDRKDEKAHAREVAERFGETVVVPFVNHNQADAIKKAIALNNKQVGDFCEKFNLAVIDELPAENYTEALLWIEEK